MLVVKIGGNGSLDFRALCADVVDQLAGGEQVVLVHGGSRETNLISERLGHPPRFVTSVSGHVSRYTDRETLEIYTMVAAGRINKLLVEQLQRLGVNALGLSGLDGRLLVAKRKAAIRIVEDGRQKILRDDFTGQIDGVNAALLQTLLAVGCVPVIAPLAISHEHEALNVDGDRVAAAIGAALHAHTVVILSNVPGLLRHYPDEQSVVPLVPLADADDYLDRCAQGRMKRKLLGAVEAVRGGVERVIIADGRVARPLQRALAGQGTVIAGSRP